MELKLDSEVVAIGLKMGSNRTFMELKLSRVNESSMNSWF